MSLPCSPGHVVVFPVSVFILVSVCSYLGQGLHWTCIYHPMSSPSTFAYVVPKSMTPSLCPLIVPSLCLFFFFFCHHCAY